MSEQKEEFLATTSLLECMQNKLKNYTLKTEVKEIGRVKRVFDGVAIVEGLDHCMINETLDFGHGVSGIAMNLDQDSIGVVIMGAYDHIEEENIVYRTHNLLHVPVGKNLIGRVVDPLGKPIDKKGPIRESEFRNVETEAPGIIEREKVNKPLQTGILAIDSMIPIGLGQRELIIGDRQTGKTQIALDTIINQKDKDMICIYVAIGQKESTISRVVYELEEFGAMEYTFVVAAGASSSSSLQYIAPFSGTAMAEYFMEKGKDVLIVYDDLSKHAVSYREISLLLKRPPGREAYPGDIFYLHSRLLERSGHLNKALGGGSITALPIIETQFGNVAAYIPTNAISITDGQIFLEGDLFHAGQRPAVNVGISVSRVGGAAQYKVMKQVSSMLRIKLAQFRELVSFSQLSFDLDPKTETSIKRGKLLMEILKQNQHEPLQLGEQIIFLYASVNGFLDNIPLEKMALVKKELLIFFKERLHQRAVLIKIERTLKLTSDLEKELVRDLNAFKMQVLPQLMPNVEAIESLK